VTEAGGKAASNSADVGSSMGTRADTVDTRCHTPGARRTTNSSGTVTVPVIASGGAGAAEHFAPAVAAGADAVLAASVFHFRQLTIGQVKAAMAAEGITVR